MIIVNIKNGLGNQMFQYAFGKVLEWKYGEKVHFDLMRDEGDATPLVTDLDVFTIEPILEVNQHCVKPFKPFSVREFRDKKQYLKYLYYKLRRKYQSNKLITESFPSQFMSIFNDIESNNKYYFLGFWQNPQYFVEFEQKIRQFFNPRDISVLNTDIAQEIINSNQDTISLHFRRGDYLNSGFIEPTSLEYYHKAIELVVSKIKKPYFYIFTDEPDWVETNFKMNYPHKIITGNNGKEAYIDILLMSKCKNHIMANSSFSWWGAWLDSNPDKIVTAPRKWYANASRDKFATEITPKEWIRI
jgi:hypothetical protein